MREDLRGERIGLGLGRLGGLNGLRLLRAGRLRSRAIRLGRCQGIGGRGGWHGVQGRGVRFSGLRGQFRRLLCWSARLLGSWRRGLSANSGRSLHGRSCLRFRLSYILRHGQGGNPSEASCEPQAKHCPCNHTEPLLPTRRCFFRRPGADAIPPAATAGKLYLSQARAHAPAQAIRQPGHVML